MRSVKFVDIKRKLILSNQSK